MGFCPSAVDLRAIILVDFIALDFRAVDDGPDIGRVMLGLVCNHARTDNSTPAAGNNTAARRIPPLLRFIEERTGRKVQGLAQAAFFTLPRRMQAVQTRICLRAPLTAARTFFRLGFQRRRRVLLAWLTTFP